MVDLAIVIVNFQMKDHIVTCLASLARDVAGADFTYSVVVVENNSGEDLAEIIAQSPIASHITLITNEKNLGMAGGVNVGLKSVSARYYFILNPDITFFERDTCKRLIATMERSPHIGLAGPKLLSTDGSLQHSCWRFPRWYTPLMRRTPLGKTRWGKKELRRFLMEDFDHARTQPVDAIMGSAMFVRGITLTTVGLMTEEYFMYFEDIDWCRMFWGSHVPVYYIHDITLRHGWQRASAKIKGIKGILMNKLTRVHLLSSVRYFLKWGI